jgi:tetratricopeptide (TPR) repeat protein
MLYPLYTCWGYFMADVHHNRGIFFSKQGKWDEALANYREVVRLNPNYIMAYYFMGNVYTDRWHAGDFENAMREYGRAWAIAPNYVQSHHQAGLVYLKKGANDRDEAEKLHAAGQTAAANQKLRDIENDWKQALVYFQKYHDIDPVFEPNYIRMAWVNIQLADLARARGDNAAVDKYLDTAERAYQESIGAWVCGAPENDVLRENWRGTHRHFSEEIYENLGSVRFMRGRYREALKAFKLAAWVEPNSVRALKNIALCYVRLGDQAHAAQTWMRIRQIAPNDPDLKKVFPHS